MAVARPSPGLSVTGTRMRSRSRRAGRLGSGRLSGVGLGAWRSLRASAPACAVAPLTRACFCHEGLGCPGPLPSVWDASGCALRYGLAARLRRFPGRRLPP